MQARCYTRDRDRDRDRGQRTKRKKDKRASDEKSGGKKPKSQQSQNQTTCRIRSGQTSSHTGRRKKATVTGTVIAGIRKQAEKAAFSLEDALGNAACADGRDLMQTGSMKRKRPEDSRSGHRRSRKRTERR